MSTPTRTITVAGHACLDIIPEFAAHSNASSKRIDPGQLYLMGPAACATGGTVLNTGIALHRLGIPTRLIGKIGHDLFGQAILDAVRSYGSGLENDMIISAAHSSSYSIVISPPGVDRSFLHCPGANDEFCPSEISLEGLKAGDLFHFGYPTLMAKVYTDGGRALREVFDRLQEKGILVSLDMSLPDPNSAAGQVDWVSWLSTVLPAVDFYLPSYEETLFMLAREEFDKATNRDHSNEHAASPANHEPAYNLPVLRTLSQRLLEYGAKVVVLKLGELGLYLRSKNASNWQKLSGDNGDASTLSAFINWADREMIAPCFNVRVVGTTGAGDSTIAGLLAAISREASPEEALVQGVAVGACSVENEDAVSGIPSLAAVQQRIQSGWERRASSPPGTDWNWVAKPGVWSSPKDVASQR